MDTTLTMCHLRKPGRFASEQVYAQELTVPGTETQGEVGARREDDTERKAPGSADTNGYSSEGCPRMALRGSCDLAAEGGVFLLCAMPGRALDARKA